MSRETRTWTLVDQGDAEYVEVEANNRLGGSE